MTERLRLYFPVRPIRVNQHFGDNNPCVKGFGTTQQIIINGLDNNSCPIGYDKLYQHFGMPGHNGMDLATGVQNVYAAADGVVVEKQTVPARGLGLGILTNDPVSLDSFGEHFAKMRYWHLKSFFVEVGDTIIAGQLIGISNSTGYSSGNHLHFELQPMDKDAGGHPFLAFSGQAVPVGVIAGAIDAAPFFTGDFADTLPQINSLRQKLIILLQQLVLALKPK